jgi:hypothetical protein
MLLDIDSEDSQFVVKFKAKDLVSDESKECIIKVCSGLANSFCFEASSLYSSEFIDFLNSCEPRKTYCVIVGRDFNQPHVAWGVFRK